jgi:hypothetical protein
MSESIQTAKDNPRMHEGWNDSMHEWIDSSKPRMKNDTIQPSDELISVQVREFCETIQTEMKRFKCDTIQDVVNRFTCSQKLRWIDSVCDVSIQYATKISVTHFHKWILDQDT